MWRSQSLLSQPSALMYGGTSWRYELSLKHSDIIRMKEVSSLKAMNEADRASLASREPSPALEGTDSFDDALLRLPQQREQCGCCSTVCALGATLIAFTGHSITYLRFVKPKFPAESTFRTLQRPSSFS